MDKQTQKNIFFKKYKWKLILPPFLLLLVLLFNDQLYAIFGENNYVTIHLMIQIFIIVTSFTLLFKHG